ncbi:CD1107 family mobile element protein [Evtepia gabavorous]|mgnify:CR=1 FL=1|uniref:DUF4366 domain-containing protein n=1 Tax=Evtepia gabavorous TaxID=2211183 RepID=UPI003AEF9FB0
MKGIRHLTAALCAVVLLCAFTLPAYASGEAWESAEPAVERPVQAVEPEPTPEPAPAPTPEPEPVETPAPSGTPAASPAPSKPAETAATSKPSAVPVSAEPEEPATPPADDPKDDGGNTTGGVDWEGLDPSELNPLTPDGQGTVVDNATDSEGKEFFTVTTADESVFYLVIDRQKNGENVYFLNTVTVEDLMALAEANGENLTPTVTPEPEPTPTPEPETESEPEAQSGGIGMLLLALAVIAVGGGAGWYFKIYRPRQERAAADLEDYGPEPDYENTYDGVEDDDTPPWDDEDDLDEKEDNH